MQKRIVTYMYISLSEGNPHNKSSLTNKALGILLGISKRKHVWLPPGAKIVAYRQFNFKEYAREIFVFFMTLFFS